VNNNKWILILQRGWVMVGNLAQDGENYELTGASVIRRWGTTKGLGQLAAEGPQPNTVLDPIPTAVQIHPLTVIARIHCAGDAWA